MRRNTIETLMGAVVLAAAALFLAFAYNSADLRAGAGYEVSASFNRVGGVKAGTDVRVGGVSVGTVTGLSLDAETWRSVVAMRIDEAYALPDDTSAAIASESLLGGSYIELAPGGSPDTIEPGGAIEYTQDSVDIVQLLGKFIFAVQDAGGEGEAR